MIATTRMLIERVTADQTLRRLCSWERAQEIPSEATFSRAFAEFAASGLPTRVQEALIARTQKRCYGARGEDKA
jgi:NAD(P)H-dependent FMN reductase